ncbi:pre-mRNA-splicing factor prp46 [Mortierella sp. AM989]|nr:pre-mRNA-splicing factor prp46 [Mortierella sp. AM989]
MGSTRSPSTSTLDPHNSHYTHPQHKRKSSKSSPEDTHDLDTSERKKKKKSKKGRYEDHRVDEDERSHHRNGHDVASSQQQQVQKLPTIKISLRLPSNPSIISPTTTSSSTHKSGVSKKKQRSSEHISVDSDGGEEVDSQYHRQHYQPQEHEYSDDDQEARLSSSHKKKKKHKHKHKHRHHKHEERGIEEHEGWEHHRMANDEVDRHRGNGEANEAGAAKITLRFGKETAVPQRTSASQNAHHSHPLDEFEKLERIRQRKTSAKSKARSRSRSKSQSFSATPIDIKQEEVPYHSPDGAYTQIGQKRPFASLVSRRSESQDTEMADHMTEGMDEDDLDDPLIGELDEPEDDDEEDEDEDEEEDEDLQNDGGDQTDDEDMMSPASDIRMQAHFGSKTVKGGQKGSKTLPGSASEPKLAKTKKTKVSKGESITEGSTSTPMKSGRKGKLPRRPLTPKSTIPAIPKKKELSVVCHKLLDNFIRKDMYVLFTEPVDPTLVPDYATVIKNPMDFSTMRAKVERNFYPNIDEFLKDFQLVCDNARLYNSKDTLYWKQADKLWEWGSKAIERERKSVLDKDEELLRAVKDEETVDVGGMGDYSNNVTASHSRAPLLSAESVIDSPISFGDTGRSHTPQQYRKTKKIKHRRDGTIAFSYSTDGSIDPASHPDPWSLVPVVQDFGSAPLVCPLVESHGLYNGQYLDDYPYWRVPKSGFRPATYLDYGPYAILGKPPSDPGSSSGVQNIPAYTGMVFGDEKGEAYVRSLAMFLDGIVDESELKTMNKADTVGLLEIKEYVRKKVETLTRGASTIVDKVAAVVREEKSGQPSELDTHVPLSLWQQKFDVEGESAIDPGSYKQTDTSESKIDDEKDVQNECKDIEMAEATIMDQVANEAVGGVKSQAGDKDESKFERSEDGAIEEAMDGVKVEKGEVKVEKDEEMGGLEPIQQKTQSKNGKVKSADHGQDLINDNTRVNTVKQPVVKLIDIRQVIRDIQAWPKILREKTDYETWKQLKIELDSLLPASQRSASLTATQSTTPADDVVDIKWGQTWTGSDLEDCNSWVREHLEQNSSDIRQIVRLLAARNPGQMGISNSSLSSVSVSPAAPGSTVGSPAGTASNTPIPLTISFEEQEKASMETLVKHVRKRLVELAQYVPLSEINPQRLPPPAPPASAAASASAPATSSPSVAAASGNAQPNTSTAQVAQVTASTSIEPSHSSLATVPVTVTAASVRNSDSEPTITATTPIAAPTPSTPDTPGEGSTSSLSSPGSSSP